MAADRFRINSRSKLLLLAAIALLLMNIRDFCTLRHSLTLTAGLISYALLFIVLWNLYQTHGETDSIAVSWEAAALAITGTTLLLVSRFSHLKPWLHRLSDIAGWLLVLACWSLPKSRWQAVAVAGFYLIVLSEIRWKEFVAFRGVPVYITICLAVLWLTISALTYRFLSRHKPTAPAPGLN